MEPVREMARLKQAVGSPTRPIDLAQPPHWPSQWGGFVCGAFPGQTRRRQSASIVTGGRGCRPSPRHGMTAWALLVGQSAGHPVS
jgi:hypothetical protein